VAGAVQVQTYPIEAVAALPGFLAREVAQAIVLGLGIIVGAVVEGCAVSF